MNVHNDDVVDVLLGQHDRLRQRFSLLRAAGDRDKKTLFDELVRLAHTRRIGEQAVVYQALRDTVAGGTTIAMACAREEAQIVRGLAELKDLGVGHPTFDTTLAAVHQLFSTTPPRRTRRVSSSSAVSAETKSVHDGQRTTRCPSHGLNLNGFPGCGANVHAM